MIQTQTQDRYGEKKDVVELSKYYPSSQTIHIRKDDSMALCGSTAQHGVVTHTKDRFGMVNCKDCRNAYMARIKAAPNGIVHRLPTDVDEGLAGLLCALSWGAAFQLGYRRAVGVITEALLDGSR
jgi:hypothetical protein